MSKVYVINEPVRVDPATGGEARVIDLSPALEFGPLVHLLPPGKLPSNLSGTVAALDRGLADYGDDDYLLLVGDPVAIGVAVAVAANVNEGRVRALRWHGRARRYEVASLMIPGFEFEDEGDAVEGSATLEVDDAEVSVVRAAP
jgi:hypothetical protein